VLRSLVLIDSPSSNHTNVVPPQSFNSGESMRGVGGAIGANPPPPEGQKNILDVSENKSSNRTLILYIFGIQENAFDITQNVLMPELLADFAHNLNGDSAHAHPLGASPPPPPNTSF